MIFICRQYILKIKNPYRSDICRMLCLAVGVYVYIWLRLDNQYCKPEYTIPPISLTFGRQCDDHTNTGRLQMPTHAPRQYFGSRVFFSQWRLVRTVPLANMLFGAKNANTHSICGGSIAAFTKRRHDPWNQHTVDRLHLWSNDQISPTESGIST